MTNKILILHLKNHEIYVDVKKVFFLTGSFQESLEKIGGSEN